MRVAQTPAALDLATTYLRLRSDVHVDPLPVDAQFWGRLANNEFGSFHNEYLVTVLDFAADWPHWEMHPKGDEVVLLMSGALELVLEIDGEEQVVPLSGAASYVLVPIGTWHTARTRTPSRLLFITAGEGTQIRQGCA